MANDDFFFDLSELVPSATSMLGLDMDDRDYLFRLVTEIDWESQVRAVRTVLRRNAKASAAAQEHIDELKRTGSGLRDEDDMVDAMNQATYDGGANSMAAIGMVAPMVEGLFSQAFSSLGLLYAEKGMEPPDDERWSLSRSHEQRWNCQYYFKSADEPPKQDIISGIVQISRAAGLNKHISKADFIWIRAMLTYRNLMFHNGLEWSPPRRAGFVKVIKEQKWEHFFSYSTSGGDPWVFYIQKEVMADIPSVIERILDGMGKFAKSLPLELVATS